MSENNKTLCGRGEKATPENASGESFCDKHPVCYSPFKREDRYIVIKRSDVDRFWRADVREQFMAALDRLNAHHVRIPQRSYVVVESDWPEYALVWQLIEARVSGKAGDAFDYDTLRTASQRLETEHESLLTEWGQMRLEFAAEKAANQRLEGEVARLREALESAGDAATILRTMIENIESKGNYTAETTVLFMNQSLCCIDAALAGAGGYA